MMSELSHWWADMLFHYGVGFYHLGEGFYFMVAIFGMLSLPTIIVYCVIVTIYRVVLGRKIT